MGSNPTRRTNLQIQMANKNTLITTSWCGPCKIIKDFLAKNPKDIALVDADENQQYCRENNVRTVPTLIADDKHLTGAKDIIDYLSTLS